MKLNRLAREKSLYLRQHSTNPVDWYPWSQEAFEVAKLLHKPIFLSIGYSSCHWCHVMEEESFSDEEVALLMNRVFVNIKVDREERPDIDAFYMKVCQFMTGSGGWPLTIIMTPDQKPFFAGTYFPKYSRYGRIGLIDLIKNIEKFWKERRQDIENATISLLEQMEKVEYVEEHCEVKPNIIDETFNSLKFIFDSKNGGFGSAPKFPMPIYLNFLIDYSFFNKTNEPIKILEKTLTKMRLGGIFDQIEYGFHRYSTDDTWLIPHFEKMLYDQSLLLLVYSKAYQITKNEFFRQVTRELIDYLFNKLKAIDFPAFYSAEDADSEGIEGKYYVFPFDELEEALQNELPLFEKVFNVNQEGNFRPNNFFGKALNVLSLNDLPEIISQKIGIDLESFHYLIKDWRQKLLQIRRKKVPPAIDNKLLTDWNGLAIAGLSSTYKILQDENIKEFVYSYFGFFNSILFDGENLFHTFIDGEVHIKGMLNDYVYSAFGFFIASQVFFENKFLELSKRLLEISYKKFWDSKKGGLYISDSVSTDFSFNSKEIYDGVVPSGNSVALYLSNFFSKLYGEMYHKTKSDELIKFFGGNLVENPLSNIFFINGLFYYFLPTFELIIVCNRKENLFREKEFFFEHNLPNVFIIIIDEPNNSSYPMLNGTTTYYICQNMQCLSPTNDFEYVSKLIKGE